MSSTRPSKTAAPGRRGGEARRGAGASGLREDQQSRVLAELAEHLAAAARATPAPEADTPGPAGQLVRRNPGEVERLKAGLDRSMRIAARAEARRLPYLATAGTAAAGWVAWGGAQLAEVLGGPAGETVAVGGAAGVCAAGLAVLRVAHRHGIDPAWLRRWWTAGAAATGWVTAAAAVGPGNWPMTAALAVGAATGSAGWLREHAVPDPGPPVPVTPTVLEPEPQDDLGQIIATRWAENIAVQNGPVAKSLLTARTELPNGIRWTVQTVPGATSFGQVLSLSGRIASGLRLSPEKLILEPGEDESTVTMTVITHDVLAGGVAYTGPIYRDGRILLGPYADGTGQGEYVVHDEVGCRSGMATGEPGSGKSAFLEVVALALRSSREWYVMFGDGDPEGGSSPLLNRIAHWPEAGPARVLAQLEALEAALEIRSLLKATLTLGPDGRTPIPITDPATQAPVREMLPSPAFPGIYWIVDELHRLTTDTWLKERKFAERLEKIARVGRKYGVVILTGSQSLLAPDYGNLTTLRGYLAARNLYAFRNQNRSETATVNGLLIPPSALPPGGGYAFAGGSGRLAMLRVAWARDMGRWADVLPDLDLDLDTDLALAPYRPELARDPATRYATALAKLQDRRATHRAGAGPARSGPAPAGPPATAARATGPANGPLRATSTGPDREQDGPHAGQSGGAFNTSAVAGLRSRVPGALTTDNVITLPRRPRTATGPGPADLAGPGAGPAIGSGPGPGAGPQEAPDLGALSAPQRTVLQALAAGDQRTGDIAKRTGLRPPAVSKGLVVLSDLGLATRIAHGNWALAAGLPDLRALTSADADDGRDGATG